MAQLIDKSAVVAEIEKRQGILDLDSPWGRGGFIELELVKDIINTLEVKEKEPASDDLETELKYYCNDYYNCDYPKQIEEGNCSEVMPHIVSAAKHFAQWQKEQMIKDAEQIRFDCSLPCKTFNDLKARGIEIGDKLLIIKE